MKNPFLFLFRARDKPTDAVSAATTFSFGSSVSGKSVNARSAIQVSTVYACVRVIAETVASLPFAVFEADKSGSQKALDHPLYRILHDEPNPEMTSFVWREAMLTHLLLWGNSYLRFADTTQNAQNKGLKKNNQTGYKGIYRHSCGKYHARINVNKRPISLGYYDDPLQAAKAYDRAARLYFGEYARTNFPS